MIPRKTTHFSRAFSLAELLVVIAVILVLMAVVLPSLHKARSLSMMTLCMSTQRQLVVLQHTYRVDNANLFCPQNLPGPNIPYAAATATTGTDTSSGWVNYLANYRGQSSRPYHFWNGTQTSNNPSRTWFKYEPDWFCPSQADVRAEIYGGNFLGSYWDHYNFTTYDLNPSLFGNRVSFDPAQRVVDPMGVPLNNSLYWPDALQNPNAWSGPVGSDARFTLRTCDFGSDSKVIAIYDPSSIIMLDTWSNMTQTPLGATAMPGSEMRFRPWQAHDGLATVGMIDGHVITLSEVLANRVGPPRAGRDFSYY